MAGVRSRRLRLWIYLRPHPEERALPAAHLRCPVRASRRMTASPALRPSFETLASQAPQDEVSATKKRRTFRPAACDALSLRDRKPLAAVAAAAATGADVKAARAGVRRRIGEVAQAAAIGPAMPAGAASAGDFDDIGALRRRRWHERHRAGWSCARQRADKEGGCDQSVHERSPLNGLNERWWRQPPANAMPARTSPIAWSIRPMARSRWPPLFGVAACSSPRADCRKATLSFMCGCAPIA